jgi:hypothetical protein
MVMAGSSTPISSIFSFENKAPGAVFRRVFYVRIAGNSIPRGLAAFRAMCCGSLKYYEKSRALASAGYLSADVVDLFPISK